MRLNPAACTAVGLLVLSSAAHAAEPIRVLLHNRLEQIEVSAHSDLQVRLPGGEVRVVASKLVLTPHSRSMRVNGEHIAIDRLVVVGADEVLNVVVKKAAPKVRPTEGRRLPAAVFLRKRASVPKKQARSGQSQPGETQDGLVVGGDLHILSKRDGLAVINTVDLEEYVQGVVPAEMNAGWHLEALKVQAVAARTYVLYQKMMNGDREYDVVSTVLDQVYRGRSGVNDRVRQAVEETKGLALTYQERPILAAFSSTAAGPTEDARNVWSRELPYLKGVECPFDRNSPYYEWRTGFTLEALEEKLREGGLEVGTIANVTPYGYSRAGRVARIRILHSTGELVLRGEDLRRIVGYRVIPSTRFEIDKLGRDVVLSGYGNGHAVGLCQWGAKELAELGYPFTAILQYYFPGTDLTHTWRTDPIP